MNSPQIAVVYGQMKLGKSTDVLRAFPQAKVFAPSEQSILPVIQAAGGFTPNVEAVVNFDEVLKFARAHQDDDKLSAIILDDIALIGAETARQRGALGGGWSIWGKLGYEIQEFFMLARFAPWHLVITSHEVGPGEYDATQVVGGPKMPSRSMGEEIGKNASVVLRLARLSGGDLSDQDPPHTKQWPVVYVCSKTDMGAQFATGDRNGIALAKNPLNYREMFHSAGINFPRAFDWQEDAVEKISQANAKGLTDKESLRKTITALKEKYKANDGAIATTLHDAWARAWWNRHKQDKTEILLDSFQ